jgi:hypothetical protein
MILGEYGAFFGGPSFPASVFSMHDETTSGAKCTQACTFMALALLADRGARIESALEITLGANGLAPDAPDCTTHEQIVLAGLTQDQVVDAINRNNGSAVAFRRSLALDIPTNNIWFERLLAAYIHARYPVIIFVDAQAWKGRAPARKGTDSVQPAVGSKEHLHAVAAVGYLRAPNQACSMRSVIVHDPSHQPYSVVPLSHLVQSARAAAYDNHRHPCDIPAVFAAPELIKHHANELLERIAELPSGRPYVLDSYRDKDREFFVRLAAEVIWPTSPPRGQPTNSRSIAS